jgi:hypothetical protein
MSYLKFKIAIGKSQKETKTMILAFLNLQFRHLQQKHEQKAFLIELYSYLVNNLLLGGRACVCVCACACVRACVRACACVRVCVYL